MAVNVLTTNLSPRLYNWLNTQSRVEKATKRVIIEEALEKLRIEKIKHDMVAGFEAMKNDKEYMKEMVWLAEAGIGEYGRQLNAIDGGYLSKRNISRKPRSNRGKRAGR